MRAIAKVAARLLHARRRSSQCSSHQPFALSIRRARMSSTWSGCHHAPPIFRRAWTTWPCALSTSLLESDPGLLPPAVLAPLRRSADRRPLRLLAGGQLDRLQRGDRDHARVPLDLQLFGSLTAQPPRQRREPPGRSELVVEELPRVRAVLVQHPQGCGPVHLHPWVMPLERLDRLAAGLVRSEIDGRFLDIQRPRLPIRPEERAQWPLRAVADAAVDGGVLNEHRPEQGVPRPRRRSMNSRGRVAGAGSPIRAAASPRGSD